MFADKLKQLRKSRNITQTQLASDMQVTKGAIGMWETNKRVPDIDMLKRLANFFGITVDELLGNESADIQTETAPTDEDIKFALFNGAEGITDDMYEEVKAFAEFVKKREQQKGKK